MHHEYSRTIFQLKSSAEIMAFSQHNEMPGSQHSQLYCFLLFYWRPNKQELRKRAKAPTLLTSLNSKRRHSFAWLLIRGPYNPNQIRTMRIRGLFQVALILLNGTSTCAQWKENRRKLALGRDSRNRTMNRGLLFWVICHQRDYKTKQWIIEFHPLKIRKKEIKNNNNRNQEMKELVMVYYRLNLFRRMELGKYAVYVHNKLENYF